MTQWRYLEGGETRTMKHIKAIAKVIPAKASTGSSSSSKTGSAPKSGNSSGGSSCC
jgi:hypothetical protein